MHEAALHGQSDCVAALLEYYPNVNMKNDKGMTALDLACQNGDKNIAKLLLDFGATLSYSNEGATAMQRAAERNHNEILMMLVANYNWDINTVSTLFIHSLTL